MGVSTPGPPSPTRASASRRVAVDAVVETAHGFRIAEDRLDAVEAGLDGDAHPGQEVAVETEVPVAAILGPLPAGGVAGSIAEVFHVVHVDAEEVPDAVRKEQRRGSAV